MHQPHDKLFKASFSDPETTAGFLRSQLPAALAAAIDWCSLRLQPGSFIDSQFRQSESDLLFHARAAGHSVAFYLLFEHQTTEDRHLALRLLRYMVRIWENHLKQDAGAALPVILPVVIAQNERSWTLIPDFASLLEIPPGLNAPLRPFIPDFTFRLIQLAEIPFDAIAGTPAGIMTLRVMKAERIAALLDDSVWDEVLMMQLPRETLEMLIRYMLRADIDKGAFDRKVRSVTHRELQTTAMTLADQLREEGLQKGLQKGLQEGLQEGLQKGLQKGLQDGLLEALEIRFTSIPDGLRDAIATVHDLNRLRRLHKAAIQAATLEEFARSL